MSRNDVRRFLAAACAVFLFGCGSGTPPVEQSTREAGATRAVLLRSSGPEIDSLDPVLATLTDAGDIIRDAYEGITTLDENARAAPGLATHWDVSPDGRTYTFHLRTDARWSNGDAVTSQDVLASWQRLLAPGTGSPWVQNLEYVERAREIAAAKEPSSALGIRALDAHTLVVQLRGPAPFFPALLAHWSLVPTYRGQPPAKPGSTISNGAYRIVESVPNSHVLLRMNAAYHGVADVKIEAVRYLQIAELGDEYNRFRTGELDVTSNSPLQPLDDVRAVVGDQLKVSPFLALYYYGFNTQEPPFTSRELRQALSMTVDREKLTDVVLRMGNPPAYSLVPDGTPDYVPQRADWASLPYSERVHRARLMYARAGYGPARPLRFELRYNAGAAHERIALAVAGMWREALGAEVKLVPEEFKSLLQTIQRGDAQVFRSSWTADFPDSLAFLQNYIPSSTLNLSGYRNAAFDADAVASITEADPAKRRALLERAERTFAADAPIVPLYFMVNRRLVSTRVRGWRDNPMRVTYSRTLALAD